MRRRLAIESKHFSHKERWQKQNLSNIETFIDYLASHPNSSYCPILGLCLKLVNSVCCVLLLNLRGLYLIKKIRINLCLRKIQEIS